LPVVWADEIIEIKQEQPVWEIEAKIQHAINFNNPVIVVGSKTNADQTLTLILNFGKTVIWQATYQSNSAFSEFSLITTVGTGTFEVANGTIITANAKAIHSADVLIIVSGNSKIETSGDEKNAISTYGNVEIKENAQLRSTTGETIATFGDYATVTVTGGTITATSENAIIAWGNNSKVLVSGGYVGNNATGYSMVINVKGSESLVHVSGTAKVEAKRDGEAIFTQGSVIVSGNAQVSNTNGGSQIYIGAVRASQSVDVKDFAKISALNNYAVCAFNRGISFSGNSIVEAKENAIAICTEGPNTISVSDQAQVIAAQNYAVSCNSTANFTLSVQGGVVFSYGKKITDVINYQQFLGPTGTGVVLAWDKQAGNTHYETYSKEDIFVSPATATAHWEVIGGKAGIYYANGTNTGFIPLEVSVLSVSEPATAGFEVYPNPTNGELQVTSYELQVNNEKLIMNYIEVFDVYGRKQKSRRAEKQKGEGEVVLDISHLPAGIYFVKVGNGVKKVVKL